MRIDHPLHHAFREIVGPRHVLTGARETARFRTGYRTGTGSAIAVVRPGSLTQLWRVAQACVSADVTIIMQASNTGLTGGSTPAGDDYPGGVVVISTSRLKGIHLVRGGSQVICLPGATLHELEAVLVPIGREPHSVIGSSCLGASVIGGVCNNSGGSLVQRGPAYTQLGLFGSIGQDRQLRLVNHLGVELGDDPEHVLDRLEAGSFAPEDVQDCTDRLAHDRSYAQHVRQIDSDQPARFNADERCLYETAGSAGKLIVFAVRLDTFPKSEGDVTFYLGTDDPAKFTDLRRTILSAFDELPVAGEYMHRTAFDIADVYGKDMFAAIKRLGTSRLPTLFAAKARIDGWADRFGFLGPNLSDRLMQRFGRLLPDHLPPRMREFRDRFEHHLIVKMPFTEAVKTRSVLAQQFGHPDSAFFECTPDEANSAFLHRFVTAGAAVRYRAIHRDEVEDIVALDIALPRNTRDWVEVLPDHIASPVIHSLYYGHFFCQVFHQDYIVRKGTDALALEHMMWKMLDERGAEYPAEHNVGHLYRAKPDLAGFYRGLDPCNQLNPGIGSTTRERFWAE
ncbi:D-lactate dehydrogenase [Sphingomonas vulcanisoli]|uniref:Quinone-dependent D-lactate dehydrogenase n=1 Tax=Sphingomonas vulcanisoli TaxID=1658060 RepID=A0ABX0TMH7_9SPHN|nr:D-lactate dehydrogenase [Sphingomonas vulcanisoli]NIJ06727.1 D-lactate dehydrogenase [Sphingomonas vulcanisoli]